MSTYHLYKWSVVPSFEDPFKAPEINPGRLFGFRDEDPKSVRTSPIVSANGREITTRSGSVYILEDIDPEYLAWLEENGYEYNPADPIKIKKIK
jgi:hypothetical protein